MATSPLQTAGAAIQPTATAPLHTNEFFTGMWSNGSPLGPGAVPYLYQKFYSASRYDRLVDGNDVEISPRLTLIRRPGHTVYNPGPFPPINRFYEFRGFSQTDEIIHLVADCDASLNQLQNPNFVSGTSGWTWGQDSGGGGGWSLYTTGGTPPPLGGGVGNTAVFVGPGSATLSNNQHIPCVAGEMVQASCWALGEPGATGTAFLAISFYNSSNALLSSINSSPTNSPNYVWTYDTVSGPAPAGAAYAVVQYFVQGSTTPAAGPRWFVSLFAGGYSPQVPSVREVTQPNTNTVLWTKDPAAGITSFVSDGNILYAGDGKNTHQWVTSAQGWQSNAVYQPGEFIIDSNNNVQMAVGSVTATIDNIEVDSVHLPGGGTGSKVTLWFDSSTPFDVPGNISITTSGLTTVPAANVTTPYTLQVESLQQCSWIDTTGTIAPHAYATETGQATTGNGSTGSTAPIWNTNYGQTTQDGSLQWVNMGSAVMSWGATGPSAAPTVTQTAAPTVYSSWAPNTWYAPLGAFVIVDGSGNLQQVIVGGQTGASGPPAWNPPGVSTPDGSVTWMNQGPAAWQANYNYTLGMSIRETYVYTTITYQWTSDGHGGFIQKPVPQQVSATSLFQVIVAGVSGANQPSWNNGVAVVTKEPSGLTWKNMGNVTGYPGTKQNISIVQQILDHNGYLQKPTTQGESGAGPADPFSTTTLGSTTSDNSEVWVNAGPYATAATLPWQWAYSGKNSVTGEISNASPVSIPLVPTVNNAPVIQGQGLPEPPWDTIVLWRTAAGGSTLLYDDEFPNPGPSQTWIYTDTNLDPGNVASGAQGMLNEQITAPIDNGSDPPPSSFVPKAYYLGRIWGFTNNILRWTGGPDTNTGSGNSTMPPVNQFRLTSKGILCWPTSIGLIVFTSTDIWAVLGQGTTGGTSPSPFYIVNFQAGIGMASQDAFCVNGSTAYVMLTSHQVVSIDPGAGEVEVGFPVADMFDSQMDPSEVYLTWHQGRSADTALYVANGSTFWMRMAAVSAPENGNVWSPAAVMRAPGQVRAMASIETAPGVKVLIAGPNVDGQPILMRDSTVNSDDAVPYTAHATIAAVTLSQPGSTAGVQFIVTEEKKIDGASALTVKMLFDEIHDFVHVQDEDWRILRNITADPPNLPRQKSLTTQRLWGLQDPSTVVKCRFYQQDISWPAEDYANEIYTNTIYGRLPEKARR